jgi:hypothetical protein
MSQGLDIFGYVVAGIIAWCILAHCVFMRICTCMKRRSKLRIDVEDTLTMRQGSGSNQKWKLLAAHRGGAAEACENTIGAFEKAIKLGLNFMECDVQLSKDG